MQHWINLYSFSSSMQTVELNMFREMFFREKCFWTIFFFTITKSNQFFVCFSFLVDSEDIKRISNTLNILASEKLKLTKVNQFHFYIVQHDMGQGIQE